MNGESKMKQYKINAKKLKLMNRKKQQQFEIDNKNRIMKIHFGGFAKYRMEYNKWLDYNKINFNNKTPVKKSY
jgi:hypothetical protein